MGVCILGMGDCTSKSSVDLTDITNNDISINNSIKNLIEQNCQTIADQSNVINIVGSKVIRLNATQKNSIESLCIMQSILDSSVENKVQQNLLDKVKTSLETSGGLLGSPAENETISKKITNTKMEIDNSKFNEVTKNCIANIKQENILNIIGSEVEDANFDQANDTFLKCLADHSDITKVTADALADTKQESDTGIITESGDIGESVGTAAEGLGEGISTAAKGVGEGVGTGAKGVGSGLSSVISSWMIPIAIIFVILIIGVVVSGVSMLQNPEGTKAIGSAATGIIETAKKPV